MSYIYFTEKEIIAIEIYKKEGFNNYQISKKLNRSYTSIGRIIKKYKDEKKGFFSANKCIKQRKKLRTEINRKNKSGESVLEATINLFKNIPKYKKKTITYDNGREFSEHRMIEYFTGFEVYFAYPYASWERGTNENINGLLRQFIPKKTDFKNISQNQLKKFINLLNYRPRKKLILKLLLKSFFLNKFCAISFRC